MPDACARAAFDSVLSVLQDALAYDAAAVGLTTTVVVQAVAGERPGVFSLGARDLREARDALSRDDVGFMWACQAPARDAAFLVVLGGDVGDERRPYRDRHIAAGALAQLVCVAAEREGLGARPMGAFFDDDLTALLPPGVSPLHTVAIGLPGERRPG